MKNKNILKLGITVILFIVSLFAVRWFYTKTNDLKTEITTLSTETVSLKTQADRLISLRQVANSTGDELIQLNKFFVAAGGALDFVKYIEKLANTSGLTFQIDLFDTVQDATLAEQDKELLRTALRTTGTFKNSKIFLSLIESLPYNVKINRVDLRRVGSGSVSTRDDWTMLVDFTVVKVIEK